MKYSFGKKPAYVTFALLAANIIYFIYLEVAGSTEDTGFMIRNGAMYAPLVTELGEYYRLFTSMFMHFGVSHIANNMLILLVLGDNLERALGKVKYFIFYIACGAGANVVSMWFDLKGGAHVVSAGASGAIFGIVGGLLYAVMINKGQLEDLSTRQLVMLIIFSLYLGFSSSGVDNVAHVAGIVIGIILASLMYRKPKRITKTDMWNRD